MDSTLDERMPSVLADTSLSPKARSLLCDLYNEVVRLRDVEAEYGQARRSNIETLKALFAPHRY